MTTDGEIRKEAARLDGVLAGVMRRGKLDRIDPPRGCRFSDVTRQGDEIWCRWQSNGVAIRPGWNLAGAVEFIEAYPALARRAQQAARTMEEAERLTRSLGVRMIKAGVRTIECPRSSHLTRVTVLPRATGPELQCTWRTNGVSVGSTGNASVAEELVKVAGALERSLGQAERRMAATLDRARGLG